jgi:hypothetical protein
MSKASTSYLVTNVDLLPVAFAQRITARQLAYLLQNWNLPCKYSSFAYVPYSSAQQRQLHANPQFSKRSLRIFSKCLNSIVAP